MKNRESQIAEDDKRNEHNNVIFTSEVGEDAIVDTENNEKHENENKCYATEDVEENLCK
ncbi:hypothetical protein HHI36_017950, partial [Cryptolaemus montrouzieri]